MATGSGIGTLGGSAGASFRRMEKSIDGSALPVEAKAELSEQLKDVKDEIFAFQKDKVFYRIVVSILGTTILFVVVAITVLLFNGHNGFDALTAIGSAAVGGLVGLLAPSPVGSK